MFECVRRLSIESQDKRNTRRKIVDYAHLVGTLSVSQQEIKYWRSVLSSLLDYSNSSRKEADWYKLKLGAHVRTTDTNTVTSNFPKVATPLSVHLRVFVCSRKA